MKMQDPILLDPVDIVRIDVRANTDDELRAICRRLDLNTDQIIETRNELGIMYIRLTDRQLVAGCYTPDPTAIFFSDGFYPMPRSVRDAIVAIPAMQPPEPEPAQDEEAMLESIFETMEYDVDGILDKIPANGLDSLDEWEVAFLERRSRRV